MTRLDVPHRSDRTDLRRLRRGEGEGRVRGPPASAAS